MTDKTRQDSGSTHIIRYALEMGLLWIDGDGRDKVREALDALDTLESQLESIGAGGVSGPLIGRASLQSPGFTAADMATAAAQGFRDGVASISAPLQSALDVIERWARDAYVVCGKPSTQEGFEAAWKAEDADAYEVWSAGRASLSANAGEPTEGAFQRALSIRAAQGWKLGGDKVPVLYTDEINGEQVCRDDLWLCTTAALAAPPTAQAEGWTKLPGQLPEPGMPVLLDIGKKYPIRAMWAAKHTVQAADDDTDWGEYVEADDMYYAPEGWYEWNQNEDNHWRVTETPRAWMPLPPTSAEGVEHG